jgi:hypothetical protein
MGKRKLIVLARRRGDYVIVAEHNVYPVNRVWWTPHGMDSEYLPAFGITNELPDGKLVLFCERDDKDMSVRELMKAFRERGIPIFLVAETKRGYHIITRVRGSADSILEVGRQLAEWGIIDPGMLEAFTIREKLPFKQILRLKGKYREPDVRVVRWAKPIDIWEQTVLELYKQHAKVEWSATRAAWGCPFYEPKASDEQLERGSETHRYIEAVLKAAGYETEARAEKEFMNIVFTGKADALSEDEVIEIKPPFMDYIRLEAAARQARIYMWLFDKKLATLMDYNLYTVARYTSPLIPPATLDFQPWFKPEHACEYCANKGWCTKCLDLG